MARLRIGLARRFGCRHIHGDSSSSDDDPKNERRPKDGFIVFVRLRRQTRSIVCDLRIVWVWRAATHGQYAGRNRCGGSCRHHSHAYGSSDRPATARACERNERDHCTQRPQERPCRPWSFVTRLFFVAMFHCRNFQGNRPIAMTIASDYHAPPLEPILHGASTSRILRTTSVCMLSQGQTRNLQIRMAFETVSKRARRAHQSCRSMCKWVFEAV